MIKKDISKIMLGTFLVSSLSVSLNAIMLNSGTNIVKSGTNMTLDSTFLNANVLKMYGIKNSGYISFDPTKASFLNSLKNIEKDKGYIIILNDSVESNSFASGSNIIESCVKLNAGTNIVELPTLTLGNKINGADILKIYGVKNAGYISFDPTKASFLNSLKSTEDGKSYIVITSNSSTGTCNDETNTSIEEPPSTPDLNGTTTDTTGDPLTTPPSVPSLKK